MQHTVSDFLRHEIEETHKNIDRIQNHLNQSTDSISSAGQHAMLALQREHLDIIQGLKDKVNDFDELIAICRANVFDNEKLHSQIAYKENPIHSQHSADWWRTLHLIQFWGDLLSRVRLYRERHRQVSTHN